MFNLNDKFKVFYYLTSFSDLVSPKIEFLAQFWYSNVFLKVTFVRKNIDLRLDE